MTSPSDPRATPRPAPVGDSTRAIRAASRTPAVLQRPTSVPIFQTATFTSPDAESLADVLGDARAGYSYSRLSNPTTTALGDAYAEIAGGEAGIALASGVRMDRHGQNARALAGWLERQEGVERVLYPGLPSHPQHAVVERQWRPDNGGGMLSFEVAGGRAAGAAIIDTLELSERTASLGSVHTMVVHPPSTSQRQLSEEELLASGIRPGLLRVSVGLEDIEDLTADFEGALAVARGTAAGAPALVVA